MAVDWVSGRMAIGALIEMILQPDSLVYRTVTDSSGRFIVGPLPSGKYLVYGVIDQNHDLRRGSRESYDSATAPAGKVIPALWMIPRDTVGPRITQITPGDSLNATINFGGPLDPNQKFDSTTVTLRLQKDSSIVHFRSVLPKELDDSLQRRAQARTDSIRIARDTTIPDSLKRPKAPARPSPVKAPPGLREVKVKVDVVAESLLKTRPKLFQALVLRVDTSFVPETKYLLEISGVRSAAGVAANAKGVLAIPKKPELPPVDSAKLKAAKDSAAAAPATPVTPSAPLKGLDKADSTRIRKPRRTSSDTVPVKPSS
jgi:hypothetical protein